MPDTPFDISLRVCFDDRKDRAGSATGIAFSVFQKITIIMQ